MNPSPLRSTARLLIVSLFALVLSSCYLSHGADSEVREEEPVHVFSSCMGTQLDHLVRMCGDGTGIFLGVVNGEAGPLQVTEWRSVASNSGERRIFGEGTSRVNLVRDPDGIHWLAEPPILPSCGDRSYTIDEAGAERPFIRRHLPLLVCP